jgi:hypothetical protein
LPDLGRQPAGTDPYNNVVRTAYEAMAAVLGGTQSLHTNALDEAIALPTEFRPHRAQHPADPAGRNRRGTNVIDPLAGSYYVESLTAQMAHPGLEADRRGRGDGRHDQGRRLWHAQAADRGGCRPPQARSTGAKR